MDRLEKRTKKALIGKVIDLAGGHFKDDEINILYDLAKFREQLSGLSKTYDGNESGRSLEGKGIQIVSTTYIILGDENRAFVREHIVYIDNDGNNRGWNRDYKTAREILSVIGKIYR